MVARVLQEHAFLENTLTFRRVGETYCRLGKIVWDVVPPDSRHMGGQDRKKKAEWERANAHKRGFKAGNRVDNRGYRPDHNEQRRIKYAADKAKKVSAHSHVPHRLPHACPCFVT